MKLMTLTQALENGLDVLKNPQMYKLWCEGEYKLEYVHYPMHPHLDTYRFHGISPDEGDALQQPLYSGKTVENIKEWLKNTYPLMDDEAWKVYGNLYETAKISTAKRQYRQNEMTLEEEDRAYKEFCDFCVAHKLRG